MTGESRYIFEVSGCIRVGSCRVRLIEWQSHGDCLIEVQKDWHGNGSMVMMKTLRMDGYVGIGRSKVICYMVVENSVGYSIIKEWISYEKWGIKECV